MHTPGLTFDTLSYSDIEQFASLMSRHRDELVGSRLASVMPQDMDSRPVASLFEAILEFHGQKLDHRVFHNRKAALDWLLSGAGT